MQIKTISVGEDERLSYLGELAQPVSRLFYLGDSLPDLFSEPLVAIVGSRKVSPYGRAVTTKLAGDLARAGVVIVSGLALGVDSIAHQAALDAHGKTIAVLPGGLDKIYPASHRNLAKQILLQGGALVSEYPAGSEGPMKHQFIARNRIISGLSQGVLITEAAAKSGSLHTAEFALEQGIDVFAVPGNITSSNSAGTNNLIKTGATPVTNADDILEALNIDKLTISNYLPGTAEEASLIQLIATAPRTNDELMSASNLPPAVFNQALTMLEINGVIQPDTAGNWIIT